MVAHSAAKLGWRDAALKLSSCASAKSKELNTTDLAKICGLGMFLHHTVLC